MKVTKFLIVTFFILSGFSHNSFAQEAGPEPLDSVLMYLENRFRVVFSYADANVKGLNVSLPGLDLDLDEFLLELEKQTHLHFQKVNSRYIAVQKNIPDQNISGIVRDRSTGERLEGSVIYSGNSHTLSDGKGFFIITVNPEKDSVIIIRHLGYKPIHLEKKEWKAAPRVYDLLPDIRILEEVTLNYIARGMDKLKDGSIQLNVQNLEILPGLPEPDVLKIIQVLPGIQSINETVSEINTRGGTNDQSLVLWDGVKMYQTGHFFGMISAFNSHLVNKTLVIKNGTGASYDEGVSGTIDLRQQDYLASKSEFSAGLDMIGADFIVKVPVGPKLSLITGARHSINGIVKTPTYKSYYKRAFEHTEVMRVQPGADTTVDNFQDFSFYDVNAKILYDPSEKDKLRLSFLHNRNTIEYEENATIRDTLYSRKSHLRQAGLLSNLSYTRQWNEDHSTCLSAFASSYRLNGSNVSLLDNLTHVQENEVLDWGLKLESISSISRNLSLSNGYHFKEVGIRNLDNIRRPNYTRDIKDVLRIHSFYAQAEFNELFRKFYLRAGLRANYYAKFNALSLEPRLALNFRINKHLSLEALAEKKSQHTTQLIDFQTDFLGVEKRRWVLSNNESIPLVKSRQYSLGIQYYRNNFLVSLEGYMKEVDGIITPSQGFQNQFQYIYSIGGYEAKGLEFLVNKRFKGSTTWFNYALAKNDYHFEEFIPPSFPNNLDVRHSLSLGGSMNFKNLELSGGFNYRSGKPFTQPLRDEPDERGEIVYENANSSRLKDYARLDLSARYTAELKKLRVELGASAWNILNRRNIYNIFYQVSERNEIETITQYTLGFTPNVSVRVGF